MNEFAEAIRAARAGPGTELGRAAKFLADDAVASINEGALVRAAINRLRSERANARHRRDSPPDLRQQGELNAFDMVLRILDGAEA